MRRGVATTVLLGAAWVLARCGGPPVSVRIRRVDGTTAGSVAVIRASVVLTNHTNNPQSMPMTLTLQRGGTTIATSHDTIAVTPSQLICWCIEVPVLSPAALGSDSTLTITVGTESVSQSAGSLGTAPLPSCDYTCNF